MIKMQYLKASQSRSGPTISTTLEAMHKGVPGLIKASQTERKPHYAERSDFQARGAKSHSAQRSEAPVRFGAPILNYGRFCAQPRA